MNPHKIIDVTPKSRGFPLWTLLVVLLVLALVSVATLGGFLYLKTNAKDKLEREFKASAARQAQTELDREKAAQKAQLALARNHQEAILTQTRNATNLLGSLLQEMDRATTEAATLRSNEVGRSVALHPDLVAQARRFYESELRDFPSTQETIAKLEGVRRVEQQLVAALETTYEPTPELSATAQQAVFWAEQGLRKVEKANGLLSGLVQESKIKLPASPLTAASPTLEAAILQLNQAETASAQKIILNATSVAKTNAAEEIAKAEAARILEEANLKATKMFIEASNTLAEANARFEEQKRKEAERVSQEKINQTKARIAKIEADNNAQKLLDDSDEKARKDVLRKKLEDPHLRVLLAPFTAPGYHQYERTSYEKQPFSYTELQSCGALNKSSSGRSRLVDLATSYEYRERPRWKLPGGSNWGAFADAIDQVTEAQKALIELGPIMVEMKMLAP